MMTVGCWNTSPGLNIFLITISLHICLDCSYIAKLKKKPLECVQIQLWQGKFDNLPVAIGCLACGGAPLLRTNPVQKIVFKTLAIDTCRSPKKRTQYNTAKRSLLKLKGLQNH